MNKVKELYIKSPILLEAKDKERLSIDNKLRFEYEIDNPKGEYRALEGEALNPVSRLLTSFLYKVKLKNYWKRKYIIKLLCFCSRCHTRTKTNSSSLALMLKRKIDKDHKWLLSREPKYNDVSKVLTVDEASRIWWNG